MTKKIELNDEAMARLDRLKQLSGIHSDAETIEHALETYEVHLTEKRANVTGSESEQDAQHSMVFKGGGTAIQKMRKDRRLSGRDCANALRCDQPTFSRYENNKLAVPGNAVVTLSRLFGCDPAVLLTAMFQEMAPEGNALIKLIAERSKEYLQAHPELSTPISPITR